MKNFITASLLAASIALGGCTTTTGSRSSTSLQREVDDLRQEVAMLKSGQGANSSTGGEIGELRAEVRRLSENVDPYRSGDENLAQQLAQLNARLDKLEVAAGQPSGSITAARNNYQAVSSPGHAPSVSSGPVAPPLPQAAATPFERGKELFDQKDYKGATASFNAYLAAEPKGANADAAQFYIAESLYLRQQYEEAILEYQKVVQGFPKSSQVPTSLLRQGISFQAIGDKGSAKLLYQKVVRDYPKSYAASVATGRLKNI